MNDQTPISPTPERKCETCDFCARACRLIDLMHNKDEAKTELHCRRYPEPVWKKSGDWCGEHKPKQVSE